MTNLLNSIINIKKNGNYNLSNILTIPKGKASSLNRANDMGTALEFFMKDSICNTFNEKEVQKKKDAYSEKFSYFGTQNHPPDLIIKNGDAMEVKKKDGVGNSELQLNSSYPKSKIFSSSSLITQACKDCESGWVEKEFKDKIIDPTFLLPYRGGNNISPSPVGEGWFITSVIHHEWGEVIANIYGKFLSEIFKKHYF